MKKINAFLIIAVLILSSTLTTSAQSTKIENAIITEFAQPYQVITLLVDEELTDYTITEDTQFFIKKKETHRDSFSKGCLVELRFNVREGETVKYVEKLKLVSDTNAGIDNFKGVLDLVEESIAYIDGRKVKLNKDAVIDCSGKIKCGCSKGGIYTDFSTIEEGDFLTVQGEIDDTGIIHANKVTVCKNEYTKTDKKLRTSVEEGYNMNGTAIVQAPTGFIIPPNSLRQGKIKVGDMEYKLLDSIRVQGYVNVVGNRLLPDYAKEATFQEKHDINFRFYVIDNPIPNAYAFPNGMVFIHTGLMTLMENEAQLAAVLGHEVAHILYEHSSSRYRSTAFLNTGIAKKTGNVAKNIAGNMLAKKLKIKDRNSTGGQVVQGATNAAFNTLTPQNLSGLFSKSKETQADRVGLMYIHLAGYDTREARRFWNTLSTKTAEPTFRSKLKDDFNAFLTLNQQNLRRGTATVNLTQKVTEKIMTSFLETIYTSHPLAQKRLTDIDRLLLTTYNNEDYTNALTGKKEFDEFIGPLK